jgi:hypothetical protein
MSLPERTCPGLGIVEPCLPSRAKAPPSGPGWIHEIKHDGFRILARRGPAGVRLTMRNGNDFTSRFPLIEMAVKSLPVRSCLIDGEAIVCDKDGLAVFELIRGHRSVASAVHCAFDLLEVKLGCEGIVSKRLGSSYRSGRSAHWVKEPERASREARSGRGLGALQREWGMKRSILWGMPIALTLASSLQAQDLTELNDLKADIWEAELAQRNFAAGLPHCSELNGTNFYFYPRDRVLNLQDYRSSLDNFVREGAFNPETRRPWNKQDADARWAQVQKQASIDQANCAAVASLPSLRQKLKELQQQQ